jgi:prevent-host-death family protein
MAEAAENEWRLYDAKNRLSEVVNLALAVGPQRIRRNKDEVVVISREAFEKLTGRKKSFIAHLLEGPSLEGLDLERDRSDGREFSF